MNKYVRKSPGGEVYTWKPDTDIKGGERSSTIKGKFCNAVANNVGEDFIVTYVYKSFFDGNNNEHRTAYVECGYVE